MQLVLSCYHAIFPRLPYPVRLLLNLAMMLYVVPNAIYRIVVGHFKNPETHIGYDQDALDCVLTVEVIKGAMAPTDEVRDFGYTLAQKSRWDELHTFIASFDKRRATYGTIRLAAIAGQGARALQTKQLGRFEDLATVNASEVDLTELDRFTQALKSRPKDHILAAITARMHIEMAWALRGDGFALSVSKAAWQGYTHHINRAKGTLAPFDPITLDSPFLALIHTLLAQNLEESAKPMRESFDIFMTLDPHNWGVMRTHAFHLLPRWGGDYDIIELEARKAMARTDETAGAAAYAAFYLGVLNCDNGAITTVEPALFEQGLYDMIEHGENDPIEINYLLAYCFDTFCPQFLAIPDENEPEVNAKRAELAKISNRLLRRTFNGHVPDAWPIPPEDVRQLVGLAHHDALLAGATIHVSQRGIEITMPEAPQD